MDTNVKQDTFIDNNPNIKQICEGLKQWYAHCGQDEYDGLFSGHCEENGFDDEAVGPELKESNLEENQLIDFVEDLDDFPYGPNLEDDPEDEAKRKQIIYDLLVKLSKNPKVNFAVSLPKFDKQLFEVMTAKDIERTRKLYQEQLPVFWNQGMNVDTNLIYVLALGQRHNFAYLCNLADDFARARVKNLKKSIESGQSPKPLTAQKHCSPEKHGHFKAMSNIKVNVIECDDEKPSGSPKAPITYDVLSKTALGSFFGRIMPKLMFSPMTKINNSIEATVRYMEQATFFVSRLISASKQSGKGACPFQFDMVIAVGEPHQKIDEEEDDFDDDDDEQKDPENDDKYYNFVGDIDGKLKANKLIFAKSKTKAGIVDRVFDTLLFEMMGKEKLDPDYVHKKRIIGLVDRRHQTADKDEDDDNVFLYEPPACARDIPNNALPEWYIGASKMVLLPDMKFSDKSSDNANDDQKEKVKKCEEYTNIGGGFGAAGSVLTLSIHAKQDNVIKMYLFCNGQCIRFMPADIKVVLPILFNMNFKANAKWIQRPEVDEIIKEMEDRIIDEEFAAFQQSYM